MGITAHTESKTATTAARAYRVFIAEDSPLMQPRIAQLAMQVEGVVICAIVDSCVDVLPTIDATLPDAAIFDINLLDGNSLPSLKLAKLTHPDMHVIVCSIFVGANERDASFAAGADRFIDKSLECDRIPDILKSFKELSRAAQRPTAH